MPKTTSFPRICIAMGFSDPQKLLESARREANGGESLLEFRLDYLPAPEQGLAVIRKFLTSRPDCTVLATCRRHQNHGKFNGSIEDQIRILEAALAAGARAVDVEIESAENATERLEALRSHARLILSYHNFEGTPSPEAILRRMLRIPADGYKIVTTAASHPTTAASSGSPNASPHSADRPGHGRNRFSHPRALAFFGRLVHLRRAQCFRRHRGRPGLRPAHAASLPRREILSLPPRFTAWLPIRSATPSRPPSTTARFRLCAWTPSTFRSWCSRRS